MKGSRTALGALLLVLAVSSSAAPLGAQLDVDTDRVRLLAGWFTLGATADDLAYARRVCVSERLALGLPLRSCADEALFANELSARRVYVAGFMLDRFEVSQRELMRCVAQGQCTTPARVSEEVAPRALDQPAMGMNWQEASALCRFRGGRLPSEEEWERAARGDSARRFPWGHFYNPGLANHGQPDISSDARAGRPTREDGYLWSAPISAFAQAHSPHGLVQMAGNVWEWTADAFVSPQSQTAARAERVVRGGSFRSPAFTLRVSHREPRRETDGFLDVGVRCAYHDIGKRFIP